MDIKNAQLLFGGSLILANRIQSYGDTLFEDFSLKQWFLLVTILNMPEQNPSINMISIRSGTSRQNIKKMLNLLFKKGYVNLEKSLNDSRALSVSLTPKARAYLTDNEDFGITLTERLFRGISDANIKNVNEVYSKLFENLNEMENTYEKD